MKLGILRYVFFIVALGISMRQASPTSASEPNAMVRDITAAQRLELEQIDQLVFNDQWDEAVRLIIKTMDEADNRLVASPRGTETNDDFVRFVPLDLFLQDRMLRWSISNPELLRSYRRKVDPSAANRLKLIEAERLERQQSVLYSIHWADSIFATSYGDEALLAVADIAIREGWTWTAIAALRRIDPMWQAVEQGRSGEEVRGFGWEFVLPRLPENALVALKTQWTERLNADQINADQALQATPWPLGCYVGSDIPPAEVGIRLIAAYTAAGETKTALRLAEILRSCMGEKEIQISGKSQSLGTTLDTMLPEWISSVKRSRPARDADWPTLGGNAQRIYQSNSLGDLPETPNWIVTIASDGAQNYALPTEPSVGWGGQFHPGSDSNTRRSRTPPIIHNGLVLTQIDRSVFAMELETGQTWPKGNTTHAIYEDIESDALKPLSGIMPADGESWGLLSADNGRLVGRFGPQVSGWLPAVMPSLALSRLMIFDLQREAQVSTGYPIRARELSDPNNPSVTEFEGAPLQVGRRMYVGLTNRSNATVTSSIACYDIASGSQLFETKLLSAARPLTNVPSNHMAQSLVSYREGTVYYHADGGAIFALDAENGQLKWLVRYPRAELLDSAYPRRRRSERVQANPIAITGSLAIAGPSDLDRLFAVDAMDGRIIWATAAGTADDVDQVIGDVGGEIIVGGDSLYRLDRTSGQVLAVWPSVSTRQLHGSLPQPARHGRALMTDRQVYWPTSEAIWILDARTFEPLRKMPLQGTGLVGGDLAASNGVLVVADGRSVAGFVSHDEKDLVSANASNR